MRKTNLYYTFLLLMAANLVLAQNPTKVFVAEGVSLYVADATSLHIKNGWIVFKNADKSTVLTLSNSTLPPQLTEKQSITGDLWASTRLKNTRTKTQKSTPAKTKTAAKTQLSTLPFGNTPFAPQNTIGNTQATVVPNTQKTPKKPSASTTKIVTKLFHHTNYQLEKNSCKTKPNFTETFVIRNSKFIIQIIARPPPSAT